MDIDGQPQPQTQPQTSSANERRLILEIEFVQCLANPKYMQFLAQHGYFNDPAFINYLKYLLYWRQPEYAHLIVYPYALEMLEYLQHEGFRRAVALESTVQLIHTKEFYHWQHWKKDELAELRKQGVLN
ncbi:SOH1-domain-containing protein [Obelidium mucronatum]|nr:SOH1-domain-containing protein [Obelidium mucronatum]